MNSIDRLKKILVGIAIVVVGGGYWWFEKQKQHVESGGFTREVAQGQVTAGRTAFYATLTQATADWNAGRYHPAALALYRAYPAYEQALNDQGYNEVAKGKTYRDEFETARQAFAAQVMERYPAMVARLKTGDWAVDEMEKVANHLPFPFTQELKQAWSRDRRAVEEARRGNAAGWLLVFISGVEAEGIGHTAAVRDALRKKWGEHPRLKLVFDKPAGAERVAGRYCQVSVSETNVVYEFAKGQQHRGSGAVPERVKVTFQATLPQGGKLRTNWDRLPPVEAVHSAPERLRFRFKNARQGADFDAVIAEQRAQLTQLLAAELEKSIPPLEITSVP